LAEKILGFGIAGCGTIENWHAEAVLRNSGARLVGAYDVYEESKKNFTGKYNIKAYNSLEELLADPEIDIVSICTPSGLHAPMALQAANAGKHIVVEKPIALNVRECDEIIEACRANNVKMTVISQLRFTDAMTKLKKAVDDGLLGRLVMGDVLMKFYRSQEYYDKGGWRGTWKMDGGGALMNQGIHGIDLLLYVMGPVKSVSAYTRTLVRKIEVEDTAVAALEFKNGALGLIQGTTSIYPGLPRKLEICGDKGTIILEEDSIVYWSVEGSNPPEDVAMGGTTSGAASNPTAFSLDGHIKQIGDMIDAVRYNRKPLVDQYEGKKPVELVTAIYESSRTGRTIEL